MKTQKAKDWKLNILKVTSPRHCCNMQRWLMRFLFF